VTTDPLNELVPSRVAWTMGNTSEALPGVATALSWTFFGPACEAGMRRGFYNLGALRRHELPIPSEAQRRFSAVTHGRFAGNIDLMAQMAERLPGIEPEKVEQQLFGEVRDVARNPTRSRYPVVAVRMPAELLTALGRLRRSREETHAWWNLAIEALGDPSRSSVARARVTIREAGEMFARNMALHTTVSMIGSGLFEQIEALVGRAGSAHPAGALVTGYGTVEETRIARDLWSVSRDEVSLGTFLRRHGWQGPDAGQLHQRVWREHPEPVRRLVETFRGMPDDASPAALAQRQQRLREEAEVDVLARLGRGRRLQARAMLALASRWIGGRETGKAGYLLAVDGARAAARVLGHHLVTAGALDDPDDVVHLTVEELLGEQVPDLRERVTERRRRRQELLGLVLPDAWVGVPVPLDVVVAADHGNADIVGTGVNPGVAEGLARVVDDPSEVEVEAGEILVCATTDPSWVSLFLAASGVVIDIGGHMSHGAIVAREMGLPCVINTRDGTQRIRTGDRLRVDGSSGSVEILERAAA